MTCNVLFSIYFKVAMVEEGFTISRYRYDTRPANQKEVREVLAGIKKIRIVVTFDQVWGERIQWNLPRKVT